MRSEVEFEMFVRQPVEAVMDQVERDAAHVKIKPEEFDRALFGWVMARITKAGGKPEWLETELKRIAR